MKKIKKQMRAMVRKMSTTEILVMRQMLGELIEAVESGDLSIVDSDPSEKPASYRPKPKGFAPK